MTDRMKHSWEGWGWDETRCRHCYVNGYDTQTEFCDEVAGEKMAKVDKAERRHAETEEAIAIARNALNGTQWDLLGLNRVAPYRDRDFIKV